MSKRCQKPIITCYQFLLFSIIYILQRQSLLALQYDDALIIFSHSKTVSELLTKKHFQFNSTIIIFSPANVTRSKLRGTRSVFIIMTCSSACQSSRSAVMDEPFPNKPPRRFRRIKIQTFPQNDTTCRLEVKLKEERHLVVNTPRNPPPQHLYDRCLCLQW